MSFNTRDEFIQAQASEKMVLAHVHATSRLYNWTVYSGSVYNRVTDHFVTALKQGQTNLTPVTSIGAVVAGTFYYDIQTSTVYVRTIGSIDPATDELIVTYRFFYASVNLSASYDLSNTGKGVLYEGRISQNPGYKSKVGIEQSLTSLIGTGDLVLENTDGSMDGIFDTLFFDNQEAFIYSWNRQLPFSEAKLLYRGRITNKTYDTEDITFTIKDQIFDLDQKLPQGVFDSTYNVNNNVMGYTRRWVYGRVDGLKLQSINQIGQGYAITGTVSGTVGSPTITGVGTFFLSELSPGDVLTIDNNEYTIESIASNTNLTADNDSEVNFTNFPATVVPDVPVTSKNRTYFVTDHACVRFNTEIIQTIQLNRIRVLDIGSLRIGDFVTFDTGERGQIRRFDPLNTVVLTQNLLAPPTLSSDMIREPVQSVFVEGKTIRSENYTISNLGAPDNRLQITLDDDVEFDLARAQDVGIELTFTNGSRSVTTIEDVDLRDTFEPRDWIRPSDILYTTYYEILSVDETSLELRIAFADPTHTGDTQAKLPDYIGDTTVISANILGQTETGEPDGEWIRTAAQTVKSLASAVGISNFNNATFDAASDSSTQLISLSIPNSPGAVLTSAKDAIDKVNKSVYGCLTIDENLDIQYRILKNDVPSSPVVVHDSDVIGWKIKTTNGKNFRNSVINYKFQDYDRYTREAGNSTVTYSSDFVRDYVGTNQTSTLNCYLYDSEAATIMSHRYSYFNRLGRSDITITTDLRFEHVDIGDVLQLEFARLYKRFGDEDIRKKLVIVVGLTKTGTGITIEATDLNNTFNTSAVITENTADDYVSADSDERLKNGYITDDQGIVNSEEKTSNINLIS